jgi:hypothetical protein
MNIEFHGGDRVYSESGVDLTLLKKNLKLTVTQRWEKNFQALKTVQAMREAGRARRNRDAAQTERPGS